MPAAARLVAPRARPARAARRRWRARVASVVTRMPPASYGLAGHAGGELVGRGRRRTRGACGCRRSRGSRSARRRRCARRPLRRPARPTATTRRPRSPAHASRTSPSGPSPSAGSLVTSRPMLSIDERAHRASSSAIDASQLGGDVDADVARRRARRPRRRRSTWCDVGGGRGEDQPTRARASAAVPGQAHRVEADRHEVGERPGCDRARLGPAERGVAVRGRGAAAATARRGCRARRVASRSSSSTARASSNRSITACESVPSDRRAPGVAQAPRRADAVGEVALGRRAEAAPCTRPRRAGRCRRRSGGWRGRR